MSQVGWLEICVCLHPHDEMEKARWGVYNEATLTASRRYSEEKLWRRRRKSLKEDEEEKSAIDKNPYKKNSSGKSAVAYLIAFRTLTTRYTLLTMSCRVWLRIFLLFSSSHYLPSRRKNDFLSGKNFSEILCVKRKSETIYQDINDTLDFIMRYIEAAYVGRLWVSFTLDKELEFWEISQET